MVDSVCPELCIAAGSPSSRRKVVRRFIEATGFDYWAGMRIRGYALLEATARSREKGDGGSAAGWGEEEGRMESEEWGREEDGWWLGEEEAICRCCRPVERNWPTSL